MQPKIVLADDEQFIRMAYKDGLERAGFTVVVAQDGAEALEKVKQEKPSIVLLDLIMPKMTGFDVLKALKADPELKNIPVIILSNLSQQTDEAEVKGLGAHDYWVKSNFSLKEIVQKVGGLVGTPAVGSTPSTPAAPETPPAAPAQPAS